jgi:hypothetical protein
MKPLLLLTLGALLLAPARLRSQPAPAADHKLIVDLGSTDLASFERAAVRARQIGATHMVITGDLPLANWEFDVPGDPYPAWYVYRPGLLKIFPPVKVRPYVDTAYADRIAGILAARCEILRRHGLKAAWNANEPQVMPEAFFAAYPELRGPRVDQPNRSRAPRFAPCTDEPETLRLYREAMGLLLKRCPEVEIFSLVTTDSGSGFCWSPGLYPGPNGPSTCKDRPMADRVSEFLITLQQAGADAGHPIEINLRPIAPRQWMERSFADVPAIVRKLPRGLAVDNREGPDLRPFLGADGGEAGLGRVFAPVVGIAFPSIDAPEGGRGPAATRQMVVFGDATVQDFNLQLFQAVRQARPATALARLTMLRSLAASMAGEAQADNLLAAWIALNQVQRGLNDVDFDPVLRMGDLLARWVNRPMVPFPEKLTAAERKDYWPFLFQAKGEAQADDLVDIQAMREYEGWGAKMLFQRVIENVTPRMEEAIRRIGRIRDAAPDAATRRPWELLGLRLEAALCLIQGADNMVSYQAQLDRVKALATPVEANPVLGTREGWDRSALQETARKEIDNTVRLRRLLLSAPGPLLDLAPTAAEEGIMRLGPDLASQLRHKVDVMNAHWEDYGLLFTQPNP